MHVEIFVNVKCPFGARSSCHSFTIKHHDQRTPQHTPFCYTHMYNLSSNTTTPPNFSPISLIVSYFLHNLPYLPKLHFCLLSCLCEDISFLKTWFCFPIVIVHCGIPCLEQCLGHSKSSINTSQFCSGPVRTTPTP